MIKKGITVTLIFIISTFVQLISQIVVTRLFGATIELDTFLAAVSIPTIIVTVIYGTLNDAFLPLLGEIKAKNDDKTESFFFSYLGVLTLVSFILAWIFGFFSQNISNLLYGSRGEVFVQNVAIQMYYMSFSIPLAVVASLLGTYYYVHKNFTRFPFAQLMGSVCNVLLILILAPYMGHWALVFAFVVNILFQIFFVIPKAIFTTSFKLIPITPFLLAWVPLIIGNFALRSDTLLIRSFGAYLPEGYLVYLNLISKIFSLATSVMTIGIQILLFPHLVEFITNKEYDKAIHNVHKAKVIAIGISIAVTIMLALISPLAIQLLFVGGKFNQHDAVKTIAMLPMFLLPAIGWGINGVFFQPLLALKKQYLLGIIHVFSLLIGWLTASIMNLYFGALPAITGGLIALLFTGVILSEIVWQYYRKKMKENTQPVS